MAMKHDVRPYQWVIGHHIRGDFTKIKPNFLSIFIAVFLVVLLIIKTNFG